MPEFQVTVDTGGTFTDLVLASKSEVLGFFKSSTTPTDMFQGVHGALVLAAASQELSVEELLASTSLFVYSTTYGTNAILEGKTARTAFVTTAGHGDMLVYREGGKPDPFNLQIPYPEPYVPRSLTFEVNERILSDGSVHTPLDQEHVLSVIDRLSELDVQAVAVCLLWSVVNPTHEKQVGALIQEHLPNVELSLSHRVNPIIREFRRASATALDASLKPSMRAHLANIDGRLRALGYTGEPLAVTHVSGGMVSLREACDAPLQTVDSGPALGPVAAIKLASTEIGCDDPDLIVTDLGGTSFDISVVNAGALTFTREKWLGPQFLGHPTGMHAVDTRSVSAGGGSIAWVDEELILHVGPHSAGAEPGPVCYGLGGTRSTVTDAAAVLGYLDSEHFAGGRFDMNIEGARHAVLNDVAIPLGLSAEEAAAAILQVTTELMRSFVYDMTIGQGMDPRSCLLISGGGGAGLNILSVAQELEVSEVLIPVGAGVLCALGGQYSDLVGDFSRRLFTDTESFSYEDVNSAIDALGSEMDEFFERLDSNGTHVREFSCEARYADQNWEIDVPVSGRFESADDLAAFEDSFHSAHERLFAVKQVGQPIECINWRARGRSVREKPALPVAVDDGRSLAPRTTRAVWTDSQWVETPVFTGPAMPLGSEIEGPALIEDPTTTIFINPGVTARVTQHHNYHFAVGAAVEKGAQR